MQDIFPSEKLFSLLKGAKLDVVTSIAMFYDLESPVKFVKEIKKILSPEGIWVFEMSYMPHMLESDSYDTICHEHLEYYSLAVIERICSLAEMKLFKVSFNSINGGSIRCYATHLENSSFDNKIDQQFLYSIRQKEFDMMLDTDKPYVEFQRRIEDRKRELSDLLTRIKNEEKRIHIYGASTKGNTILQWCNLDNNLIDYAAERNPDKYGAITLGTNIPIISEEESRKMKPDFYLVLPWHFRDEFLKRERDILDQGTGLIFPLPKVEIFKK